MSKPANARYTVAVDFDGVIHSYTSAWVAEDVIPDPPVEGAIEWLNEIADSFDIAIFTTRGRSPEGRVAVRAWLVKHGVHAAAVEADPFTVRPLRVTAEKPPALVYLDDRGLRFNGPGTFPTADAIHRLRPWNKQ